MKIAYVGNFQPEWSTENDMRVALESLGHSVVPLQENRVNYQALRNHALNSDMLLWTGTWDEAQPLNETMDTFIQCRVKGIPTVTYHLDVFHGTNRHGRRWWLHPMMYTQYVMTADGDHDDEWLAKGINHTWLRPGVRPGIKLGQRVRDFACDVAFVGSDGAPGRYHDEWPYRAQLVSKLEEICTRRGWSFRNPGGRQPKVDRGQMADFYASAKVTVGDSLCPLREASRYWSDRAYEAPGRGAVLIMPRIDALVDDYDGLLPTYEWGEWDSLEMQIDRHLNSDKDNENVRVDGYRLTQERHTYTHRAKEIIKHVGL